MAELCIVIVAIYVVVEYQEMVLYYTFVIAVVGVLCMHFPLLQVLLIPWVLYALYIK